MEYFAYAAGNGEIKVYDGPQSAMSQPLVGRGDSAFMKRLYEATEYDAGRMHVPGVTKAESGLEALDMIRNFRAGMEAAGFV